MAKNLLAIDVGGTFVDAVMSNKDGYMHHIKFPKSWLKEKQCPLRELLGPESKYTLLYSTTLTLNRLLSGTLPKIALVVNKGFHSILETARLPRDSHNKTAKSLVPLELIREIGGRINSRGQEVETLDDREISAIEEWVSNQDVCAVVIALINSFLEPKHELTIASRIKKNNKNLIVLPSTKVSFEINEYERTLAAVLNGSLVSSFQQDVEELVEALPYPPTDTFVMQSNGGISKLTPDEFFPVETLLSGPVAAANRVRKIAEQTRTPNAVSLDIGGTSTDVSLITDGKWEITSELEIAGFPIRLPMVNVRSVGSGGGSIAYESPNGRWHVGPASAGSDPGPACFNFGNTAATLTDAHLILGRIPEKLAAGNVILSLDKAAESLKKLGDKREYSTQKVARSILEIAMSNMCGAIRQIAAHRGVLLEDYTLIATGGAGPLHAAELANLVGVTNVLVPTYPGTASALGILNADISRDLIIPVSNVKGDEKNVTEAFAELEKKAQAWLKSQGATPEDIQILRKLDLRYEGMTHKSIIDCPLEWDESGIVRPTIEKFHKEFESLTGQDWKEREEVEILNVRISAIARLTEDLEIPGHPNEEVSRHLNSERLVGFLGYEQRISSTVVTRKTLKCGDLLSGPCVIEESTSTTIVPPNWCALVDEQHNLTLRKKNTQ
ncbi:MAG: hydantoinase/oxoprolinase family protein [Pseudomonadota bacterium]|nr:hydantoinase/oxoprolinase family protein [Pseudomonadota bacterium]